MSSELMQINPETKEITPIQSGPMQLITLAMERGADTEQLSKLLDLQERWEAREARKAYFDARTRFQATVPAIVKADKAHNTMYASLGRIADTIKHTLMECGLSYRFEIQDTVDILTVTCIVSHRDGHDERTTMSAAPDTSGSKSAIQSRASSVTYLQRYTLTGALGLAAGPDTDGSAADELITPDQAAALKERLMASEVDVAAFCKWLKIQNVDAMPASKYGMADRELTRKEASRASS